jgi:hypothetical protein
MTSLLPKTGLRTIAASQLGAADVINSLINFLDVFSGPTSIEDVHTSTSSAPSVDDEDLGKVWMWGGSSSPSLDADHEWAGLAALNTVSKGDLFAWTTAGWAHVVPWDGMVVVLDAAGGGIAAYDADLDAEYAADITQADRVVLMYGANTSSSSSPSYVGGTPWVPIGGVDSYRFGWDYMGDGSSVERVFCGYVGTRKQYRLSARVALPAIDTTLNTAHGVSGIYEVQRLSIVLANQGTSEADPRVPLSHNPAVLELYVDQTNIVVIPRVATIAGTAIGDYDDCLLVMEYTT